MPRERFQNNARLVLAVTGGLLLVFLLAELLLRKSRDFQPDFLASALLYGLTVLNLSLLLVLLFVLGRNLVRMLMEWRRGVFGARLRVQLLLVFLLMAVAPSMLHPPRRQRPHPPDRRPLVQRGRRAHALLLAGPRAPRSTPRRSSRAGSTPACSPARSRPAACSWPRGAGAGCGARGAAGARAGARPRQRLRGAAARWSRSWTRGCRRPRPGTRPRARRWPRRPSPAGEMEAIGRLRGGPARARGGRPSADADGRPRGRRRRLELLRGGGGRGGPGGPGGLREVPQDPDLPRADHGLLPLPLPLPGAAHPVRRGVAGALPGAPHHDPAAPRGRGRRAHRRRASAACASTSPRAATSSAP